LTSQDAALIGSASLERGQKAAFLVLGPVPKSGGKSAARRAAISVIAAKKPAAQPSAQRAGRNTEKTMFAVIKTGGKQYTVAADKQITVMALPGEAGERIVFDDVLALFDGATHHLGAPRVAGASVVGEIVEQTRGPKVIAFKKRRRKNSKRKRGHRQDLTIVRVTDILTGAAAEAAHDGERSRAKDSLAAPVAL
jgi:large subunit ribosomal protein L21